MKKNVLLGFALTSGLLGGIQIEAGAERGPATCDAFVRNIITNQGSQNSASAPFSAIGETSISGVINTYTKVTAFGCNSITVASVFGYNQGDTVLVVQMKGASIDTISNTPVFGSILKYNEAGNYEFNTIKSISGNIIYLKNALLNAYDPTGLVQLIRVPSYNNVTVSGILTALPWNGDTGGVLVFNAAGTVTLNANIDVTGTGFNGGITSINNWPGCSSTGYYYTMTSGLGGQKGEGITAYGVNYEAGRGALANGGGGGNNTNAGGAGGGNYGIGGRGGDQYQGCATTPLGGEIGNALTYSNAQNKIFLGGGGGGGHQNDNKGTSGTNGGGIIIIKANVIVANNFSLISDGVNNTVFLGNDGAGGGGAGGTILLDIINYSTALKVQAKGGNGGNNDGPGCHGPGGGGGGGVIWLNGAMLPGNISAIYNGGSSGTTVCNGTSYGAASGALGGIVYNLQLVQSNMPASPLPTITLSPDPAVICSGNSITLTASGATSYLWSNGLGTAESITVKPTSATTYTVTGSIAGCSDTKNITMTVNPIPTINILASANPICEGNSATLTASGATTYSWNGGLGNTNSITVSPTSTATYTVTGITPGCIGTTSTTVTVNPNPTVNVTASNGQIVMNAVDGTPPYQYSINGIDFQSSDIFTNIQEGSYTAITKDINNCITLNEINAGSEMITIPNFFTPNNDGFHDTWEIKGIQSYPDATIQVFDRFGKLLTTYKGSDTGWNGLYKNTPLPSDDYWYVVKLSNNIDALRGHVTLKR